MCSCEGKQIQLLSENSSRWCQKPTSCIFAKNPHAPCFPSGGAHWGGTSGTMAWPGRGHLKTVELGPFSSCWEHGDRLVSASPTTQLNLSMLTLGLPQTPVVWSHGLTIRQPQSPFALPQPGAPASSCTRSAGMPLGNIP